MPEYRRSKQGGGSYFFTVVSYRRIPILTHEEARSILHLAWQNTLERYPFITEAVCLLPDHLHCIWTLPAGDDDYSIRWGEIKRIFSKEYLKRFREANFKSESRITRGETSIWQRRFWEHAIRDEQDWKAHMDYIHFNPVKHGLVSSVSDWPWSSFHRLVKMGDYEPDWGKDAGEKTKFLQCGE